MLLLHNHKPSRNWKPVSSPLKDKSEEKQVSYILIWLGNDGIKLVYTWCLSAENKKVLSSYWTCFTLKPSLTWKKWYFYPWFHFGYCNDWEVTSNQIKGIPDGNPTMCANIMRHGQIASPRKPCRTFVHLCGCYGLQLNISERSLCLAFESVWIRLVNSLSCFTAQQEAPKPKEQPSKSS